MGSKGLGDVSITVRGGRGPWWRTRFARRWWRWRKHIMATRPGDRDCILCIGAPQKYGVTNHHRCFYRLLFFLLSAPPSPLYSAFWCWCRFWSRADGGNRYRRQSTNSVDFRCCVSGWVRSWPTALLPMVCCSCKTSAAVNSFAQSALVGLKFEARIEIVSFYFWMLAYFSACLSSSQMVTFFSALCHFQVVRGGSLFKFLIGEPNTDTTNKVILYFM